MRWLRPICIAIIATIWQFSAAVGAELRPITESGDLALDLLGARCSGFFAATSEVAKLKSAEAQDEEQADCARTSIAELDEAERTLLVGTIIVAVRLRGLTDEDAVNQVVDAKELFRNLYLSTFMGTGLGKQLSIWEHPLWRADAPDCGKILDAMVSARENAK